MRKGGWVPAPTDTESASPNSSPGSKGIGEEPVHPHSVVTDKCYVKINRLIPCKHLEKSKSCADARIDAEIFVAAGDRLPVVLGGFAAAGHQGDAGVRGQMVEQ